MSRECIRSLIAVLCCFTLIASLGATASIADQDPVAQAQSAIEAIGLVSYRPSVLQAIEAAEAAFGGLDEAQKAQVANADALAAAREEYNSLAAIVDGMKIVWQADVSSLEGVASDNCEFAAEDMGDSDEHAGAHWVISPTANWSVWGSMDLDISGYDFNQLKLRMSLRRTGEKDGIVGIRFQNGNEASMLGSKWYGEIGAANGEWTLFEIPFTGFENPQDWSKWTADTWNSSVPITQFRIAQDNGDPADKIEVDGFAIYNDDVQVLVNAANAVVDQIAAIGSSSQSAAIAKARADYNELNETQKKLVVNEGALCALEDSAYTPADVEKAIDAIGLVSYRSSVLQAIEAAEAAFDGLDDAQKAQVSNADALAAAREEYNYLATIADSLKIVWQADTSSSEGVSYDNCEFAAEDMGDSDEHAGAHWVISPTANWSVWGTIELDISGYDFDQLKLGMSLRRTGGDDSLMEVDVRNARDQRLLGSKWYGEVGADDGEWTYFEIPFNQLENPLAGIDPWPKWTADTWDSSSAITMFRLAQPINPAMTIEIDHFAIYNDGSDTQALLDEANAVVDQIAAIGEITSAAQDEEVNAARAAFDALSETQQALVVNSEALRTMELAVRQHKTAANVVAAIAEIGEVTAENIDQKIDVILNARETFDAYYEKYNDESLISNLDVLLAAEGAVNEARLQDIANVESYISAIGDVTKENSAEALPKIEAAERERDALAQKYGDAVLDEVDNLEVLTAARAKYEELNPAVMLGDINGDGKIDASDALIALQHSVQLTKLEGDKFAAADVNRNGVVDASDALLILQYSVHLITEFAEA